MTGRDYLEAIRTELRSGRRQHKMGQNVLGAFGYVRRRADVIREINQRLDELGLVTEPAINSEMPFTHPRIRFSLSDGNGAEVGEVAEGVDLLEIDISGAPLQDIEDNDLNPPEPAFNVSELASANRHIERVPPDASVQEAYTKMVRYKYSQLVVASIENPRVQDIKGIVSFQSMAKALMNGQPTTVRDCMEKEFAFEENDTDLKTVVNELSRHDVVLVIGKDKRLQGIVTAWDLAEEFAELVDPFKRIGEIEERLRALIRVRIGKQTVADFLKDQRLSDHDPVAELEELTMGELQRVLQFPAHWDALKLAFDRGEFIDALDEARGYRNRLMHFRDPLTEGEMTLLTNICDMVRDIQL